MWNKDEVKRLLDTAAGRVKADLVIKNALMADVFGGRFIDADVALCGSRIAAVSERGAGGDYEAAETFDAAGLYLLPGFIESHIHVESTMVGPREFSRLLVPRGTTTAVADPHEIVNVAGMKGLEAMLHDARGTALDIVYMVPSCVPSTPFEYSGAEFTAADIARVFDAKNERFAGVLGLGEFMDYPAVIGADGAAVEKLLLALNLGLHVDGHSPGVSGKGLNAYAAFINTDHEYASPEAMQERITRGMYVLLRQGSACHDLRKLLKGLTAENARRCVLCSDDRQPRTILSEGHIDGLLRICVEEGVEPMTAIRMATLNAAECFGFTDRGAIAPGRRADLVLCDNPRDFNVKRVYTAGRLAAEDGRCLIGDTSAPSAIPRDCFNVKDFHAARLRLVLKSGDVYVIDMMPGTVVTGKGTAKVKRGAAGEFVYDPAQDIAKIAVVERHRGTGKIGLGLLRGYGLKKGAVALSISHDSHNIICVGVNDADMETAVLRLAAIGGGALVAADGKIVEEMALPLGGIMSDQNGMWVDERLDAVHQAAFALGVNAGLEPVMGLAFMSLAVIPELKLTCDGLFDVVNFNFIPLERTT